jgi:hypothetical protein
MYCLTLFLLLLPLAAFGASCPKGTYEWQGKCYYFEKKPTGFPEAEAKCNTLGGHLPSIHDGFTNALITEHARDNFGKNASTVDFWIGLSNIVTPTNLSWIDGTAVDFSDWDKKQPGNFGPNSCGAITLKNGLWRVNSCFGMKMYVCEVDKNMFNGTTASPQGTTTTQGPMQTTAGTGSCSGNYTYFAGSNSCYGVFFTQEQDGKSWNDAEAFCVGLGGHLASIHGQAEFDFIMNFNYPANSFYWPWTGLSSQDQGQTWQWSDGSSNSDIPWASGEPDTTDPYYCAFATSIGVENLDCPEQAAALCKIPSGPPPTGTPVTQKPMTTVPVGGSTPMGSGNCTGNFTYYQPTNACYGVFFTGENDGKVWQDAETFCVGLSGHLASIHSQDEFNFIMNFNYPVNSFYWPWTGLSSKDQGQTWQWSDGSTTDDIPWGAGEPDLSSPYYCAFANSAGIDNFDCGDIGTALCKIMLS